MENIRQAVERARAGKSSFSSEILQSSSAPLPQHMGPPTVTRAGAELQTEEARLDSTHLASQANRLSQRCRPAFASVRYAANPGLAVNDCKEVENFGSNLSDSRVRKNTDSSESGIQYSPPTG